MIGEQLATPLTVPKSAIAAGPWKVISTSRLTAAAATVSLQNLDGVYPPSSLTPTFTGFRFFCHVINDGTAGSVGIDLNNANGDFWVQRLIGSVSGVTGNLVPYETNLNTGLTLMANGSQICSYYTNSLVSAYSGQGLIALAGVQTSSTVVDQVQMYAAWSGGTYQSINRVDFKKSSGNFAAGSLFIVQGWSM